MSKGSGEYELKLTLHFKDKNDNSAIDDSETIMEMLPDMNYFKDGYVGLKINGELRRYKKKWLEFVKKWENQ